MRKFRHMYVVLSMSMRATLGSVARIEEVIVFDVQSLALCGLKTKIRLRSGAKKASLCGVSSELRVRKAVT